MSSDTSKPKSGRGPRPAIDPLPSGQGSSVTNNVTGRVRFDDRGNAVWEWAVGTGKFGTDISTSRLQKLDSPDLSIVDDTPPAARLVKENSHGAEVGYSPYDSGLLGNAKPDGKDQAPRRKDLRRLGEWLKLKKQVDAKKRGDR